MRKRQKKKKAIEQVSICLGVMRAENKNKASTGNRDYWGSSSFGRVGEGFSEQVVCEESLAKVNSRAGQKGGAGTLVQGGASTEPLV